MDRLLFGTYAHSVVVGIGFVPYIYVFVMSNMVIDVNAELGDCI